MRQTFLTLALAPLSLAADATLTMFYPLNDDASADGQPSTSLDPTEFPTPSLSIVTANPQTTVAVLGCGQDIPSTECILNGFTYTAISTTVYKYHYVTDIMANAPLTVDIDCTGAKPAVTCTTNMPGADKLSISGVDPGQLSDFIMTGTSTYTGDQISFIAAPVTAGQELLQGQATPSASAGPKESGSAAPKGTQSGAVSPSPSGEKPAQQSGNAAVGRVGGGLGVAVGAFGLVAAGLL